MKLAIYKKIISIWTLNAIKIVSSSTSHKKTPSLHLYVHKSVQEFMKIIAGTSCTNTLKWFSPLCNFLSLSLLISFSFPLSFSYFLSKSLSTSLFCSMQTLIYILKGHIRPLLCCMIFNNY